MQDDRTRQSHKSRVESTYTKTVGQRRKNGMCVNQEDQYTATYM